MQTILVLFGSPNKQGHTAALCRLYLEQYAAKLHDEVEVKTLPIYQQCILPCIGCGKCDQTGVCPYNEQDDAGEIFAEMQAADHIIVAAPVYFSGFPAPLKSLIDRAQQLYTIKFGGGGGENRRLHKGALIATCGSADGRGFSCMEIGLRQFFDCMDIALVGKLFAVGTDDPKKMKITDETPKGEL